MFPITLLRGAIPKISKQRISNFNAREPLGPGIYATDSAKTARYYTNDGRSVYNITIKDTYSRNSMNILDLNSSFSELEPDLKKKVKSVIKQHYKELPFKEEFSVLSMLFNRMDEIERFNDLKLIEHKLAPKSKFEKFASFVIEDLLGIVKDEDGTNTMNPVNERDVIDSLVEKGIWAAYGSIEGSYAYSGAMDAGVQYLIYDENAIESNIELTNNEFFALYSAA